MNCVIVKWVHIATLYHQIEVVYMWTSGAHLEGTSNPSIGQNFSWGTWFCILLGRRNGQMGNYIPIHGLWPMAWLDNQGRNMFGKLVKRSMDLPEWVNAHQKVFSAVEDFNQAGRMSCSMNTSTIP